MGKQVRFSDVLAICRIKTDLFLRVYFLACGNHWLIVLCISGGIVLRLDEKLEILSHSSLG